LNAIPKGFEEQISYGMLGYVVPHSIYPNGYHCTPKLPLPFISIGSQKNNHKLDMGKGCIRFKKIDQIPFDLIAELAGKISVEDWIECYETKIKKPSR
jgi:hypothetical protein